MGFLLYFVGVFLLYLDGFLLYFGRLMGVLQYFGFLMRFGSYGCLGSREFSWVLFCGLAELFLCRHAVYLGVPYTFLIKFSYL
jgi:hypothetical protein